MKIYYKPEDVQEKINKRLQFKIT